MVRLSRGASRSLSHLQPRLATHGGSLRFPADQKGRDRQRTQTQPWRAWYKTAKWQRLRAATFERDLFTCQECGRIEGRTSHLICDHIKPHRGDERLFWDPTNLQTLCKSCHDAVKQAAEQASLHQRGVWD